MNKTAAIILAAGKSKRMKTKSSKILHPLMGKAMIDYVLDAVEGAGISDAVLVVGHNKQMVIDYVGERTRYASQDVQNGTGHAVMQALPQLEGFEGDVLVLCGDMPLLSKDTLIEFIDNHRKKEAKVSLLTALMPDAGKFGRIIRDDKGSVTAIVEAADATEEQLKINEVNTGTYVFDSKHLRELLPRIGSDNAQGEIYLTDSIALTVKDGGVVESVVCADYRESLGVNNRADLAEAAGVIKRRINKNLAMEGVTIYDPDNTYIEASVKIGNDTTILPGTMITGKTTIGSDCVIGPHTTIDDSEIGEGVTVKHSVINQSKIGDGTTVGPFAHVRPHTETGKNVKIGNFVETKKSKVGDGSKISHLTYVGDSTIGVKANVGAGTITCNYDGKNKNKTTIGDGAFIGSNSCLVAPVTIGNGSATGAGSVVTKNVPDGKLAVGAPARVIKTIKRD